MMRIGLLRMTARAMAMRWPAARESRPATDYGVVTVRQLFDKFVTHWLLAARRSPSLAARFSIG